MGTFAQSVYVLALSITLIMIGIPRILEDGFATNVIAVLDL